MDPASMTHDDSASMDSVSIDPVSMTPWVFILCRDGLVANARKA